MSVSEICVEGIFVTFPWWLQNVKSRSKIALFFKWVPFWNLISKKKRTITFFWSKLSKNYTKKKKTILHVATTFSLKQGETRTSHGPIPHPLREEVDSQFNILWVLHLFWNLRHLIRNNSFLCLIYHHLNSSYLNRVWTRLSLSFFVKSKQWYVIIPQY